MRHNKKFNHLGRTSSHRNAMLSNMCASLILSPNKRIFTTVAKAKALKKVVEPIITKSKEDSTHSRRLVFQDLLVRNGVPKPNFLKRAKRLKDSCLLRNAWGLNGRKTRLQQP